MVTMLLLLLLLFFDNDDLFFLSDKKRRVIVRVLGETERETLREIEREREGGVRRERWMCDDMDDDETAFFNKILSEL
jgi:hypothetical protein